MLNKPTYGSQPIKNEQSGMNKSEGYNKYQKSTIGCDVYEKGAYDSGWDDGVQSIKSQLTHILTAAKVSTVDEVVQMLEHQPLSDEDIERAASKYAFENNTHRSNSKAFIAGANFTKEPLSNEWVKVEDVKKYLTEQEKHSLEMCKVAKENRDIFLEGISTGECVAFSLVSAFITSPTQK